MISTVKLYSFTLTDFKFLNMNPLLLHFRIINLLIIMFSIRNDIKIYTYVPICINYE